MNIKATIKSNWRPLLSTIFIASFLLVVHIRLYQYAFDDAFIHFRVVRNLFENGTPYYNINEIVKVSTSSGWSVFLILLYGISHFFKIQNDFPMIVGITNAIITFSGMMVYTKIVELLLKEHLSLFKKKIFQILFLSFLLTSSIGLMETPFALLIAGLGIYLLLLSRPSGFALLGFAAYIRVELLILLALAGLSFLIQGKFRIIKIIGYTAIGTIPLVIYDLYFFHTVIPQSIIAKSIMYSIPPWQTALTISKALFPPIPFSNGLFLGAVMVCLILFLATVYAGLASGGLKGLMSHWLSLFCLWSLLVISGYILTHACVFEWYIPIFTIPFLLVCYICTFSKQDRRYILVKTLFPVFFLLSVISIISVFIGSINDPSAFGNFELNSRVKVYRNIGSILNEEYPNATLLSSEIGGLGYSFKGEILDAAGLASPGALKFHPMKVPEQRLSGGIGAIPPEYVRENMPDLIVSYDFFAQALLSDEVVHKYNMFLIPAFLPEDATHSVSKMIWGNKFLRVYIRNDLQISEKIYALSHSSY